MVRERLMIDFDDYEAGRFSTTADTPLGRELWSFLNEHETVHSMEVATDLHHPAVAGIEEALLKKFGDAVLDDRIKQMIGHMVRQVMERNGYVVDQNNVKLGSIPFSKATRYKRPEWFRLFVFRNAEDSRDLCFSDVRSGAKLPNDATWTYWSSFATTLRGAVAFGIDPRKVRDKVRASGYARHRMERVSRAP